MIGRDEKVVAILNNRQRDTRYLPWQPLMPPDIEESRKEDRFHRIKSEVVGVGPV